MRAATTGERPRSDFLWRETVGGTPNPGFRKIDIRVADPTQPDYALAQLAGGGMVERWFALR